MLESNVMESTVHGVVAFRSPLYLSLGREPYRHDGVLMVAAEGRTPER